MKNKLSIFALLLAFAFFIVPFTSAQTWTTDLDYGLKTYYNFDDLTTTNSTEQIRQLLNGTANAGTTHSKVTGILNGALEHVTGSYIYTNPDMNNIGGGLSGQEIDSFNFSATNQITVSAWYNFSSANNDIQFGQGQNNPYEESITVSEVTVTGNDVSVLYKIQNQAVSQFDNTYTIVNGKDQWHHIVATANGTDWLLYIDGTLVNQTSYTGILYYNPYAFLSSIVGELITVDELAIWEQGITQSQVTALYNSGSPLPYTLNNDPAFVTIPADQVIDQTQAANAQFLAWDVYNDAEPTYSSSNAALPIDSDGLLTSNTGLAPGTYTTTITITDTEANTATTEWELTVTALPSSIPSEEVWFKFDGNLADEISSENATLGGAGYVDAVTPIVGTGSLNIDTVGDYASFDLTAGVDMGNRDYSMCQWNTYNAFPSVFYDLAVDGTTAPGFQVGEGILGGFFNDIISTNSTDQNNVSGLTFAQGPGTNYNCWTHEQDVGCTWYRGSGGSPTGDIRNLTADGPNVDGSANNFNPFFIGSNVGGTGANGFGWVDDFRIFDGIIDTLQIDALYNSGSGTTQSLLLALLATSNPPQFDVIPANATEDYADPVNVQFIASDPDGDFDSFAIDNADFSIAAGGVLTNATTLPPGVHVVTVTINDSLGNTASTVWQVTVGAIPAPPANPGILAVCTDSDATWVDASQLAGLIMTILLVGLVLGTLVLSMTGVIDLGKLEGAMSLQNAPAAIVVIGLLFLVIATMSFLIAGAVCPAYLA